MISARTTRRSALLALLWLAFAGMSLLPAEAAPKVVTVAFGLDGDQGVFEREAVGAAQIVAARFGGPTIVRFNTRRGGNATAETLAAALRSAAAMMDRANDVLVLILTSHGSPEGIAVKAGRREELLSPGELAAMLAKTGVRHKAVIISACYSGVFVRRLADPDTLVITAADAEHTSFGCTDEARWTYFGDAFFNVALRKEKTVADAFSVARSLIRKRELAEGFTPSNPQMQGGEDVLPLLVAR